MAQRPSNESFDTGSNYNFTDKMLPAENPRSVFDLSHLVSMTVPNAGVVFPVSILETLPGDDFQLSAQSLLRVMPQVVPMYSRQRLYLYAFWSRSSDLWNNFQTFARRGMSGNVVKTIPCLNNSNTDVLGSSNTKIKPDSLGDCLGLPINADRQYLLSGVTDNSLAVNALPFMMYLRIWRDYFCNKNQFINDAVLFPDDDSRFRLGDNGNILSASDEGYQVDFDVFGNFSDIKYRDASGNAGDMSTGTYNRLSVGLFYHDFAPDRFTTALPFAQRGDVSRATISLSGSVAGTLPALDVDFSDKTVSGSKYFAFYDASTASAVPAYIRSTTASSPVGHEDSSVMGEVERSWASMDRMLSGLSVTGVKTAQAPFTAAVTSGSFNLNDLRNIMIAQTEMEKLARTDGSYAEFGLTFFGEASKAAVDYRPTFVGGTYQNILFSEVLQNSASTSSSPLGAYAGHGISGSQDPQYIGSLHCDDYGYLMLLACIMPDTYYSQGIEKLWTRRLQTEYYLPERSKLGMQPIYNYEVYLTNAAASVADNDGLWAYNDPFDEYRSIPNRIKGKIADSTNQSFFPYTQSRKFSSLPNWSREFSEASNVRKDYLAAPSEDAYTMQVDFDIRCVRRLPYKAVPALFA